MSYRVRQSVQISRSNNCGDTGWFNGLNSDAQVTITCADVDSSLNAWMGGSSTNALAFGLNGVTEGTAAVLLTTRPDVDDGFMRSFVVDKVVNPFDGGMITVTGIIAMSAYNMDGMAYGVFEAAGYALVFFHVYAEPTPLVSFQMIQDYTSGYGCELTRHMISRSSGLESEPTLFVLDKCAGNGALVG